LINQRESPNTTSPLLFTQMNSETTNAILAAETFVQSSTSKINELHTAAFAIIPTPQTTAITKIAFRYDETVSAFNHSSCRVVLVQMDTLVASWDTGKDQQITADMVPIAALNGNVGQINNTNNNNHNRNNSSNSRTHSRNKSKSSISNAASLTNNTSTSAALGSYLVLARTNPTKKNRIDSNNDATDTTTTDTDTGTTIQQTQSWVGQWYDETHEEYVVQLEDGAFQIIPLNHDNNNNNTASSTLDFQVRVPPVPSSTTNQRSTTNNTEDNTSTTTSTSPTSNIINVQTSHPTHRFLSIQRASDTLTIYLSQDTTQHWDIKVRSKRGGNTILSFYFTTKENDIVLISTSGIEVYTYFESKKQWKRTLGYKKTIGCCWTLPSEHMMMVRMKNVEIMKIVVNCVHC
jgi:hypothetical protein